MSGSRRVASESAFAIVSGMLWASTVFGASINLFSDPGCTACNLTIPMDQSGTLYIRTSAEGLPGFGLGSGEFRVTGLPAGWFAISTPAPEVISVGDPLGADVGFGFHSLQTGTCIPLYSVLLVPTEAASDVTLQVTKRDPSSIPSMPCPWLAPFCGPSCDIVICVDGGSLFINSSIPCTVGVIGSSWQGVKNLYR